MMLTPETAARKILSAMITRFGVRPNGSVQSESLQTYLRNVLAIENGDVAAGLDFAAGKGWIVQQDNGLIRITDKGFVEA